MPSTLVATPMEFDAPWPEKYEIIDGEPIKKAAKTHPKVVGIMLLVAWLGKTFPPHSVGQLMPIVLHPNHEPDAGAVLLAKPFNELTDLPRATDVLLVAGVSDFDLERKAALYARAEIAEYWVLDVANRRLIVQRRPQGGAYHEVIAYTESESVVSLAAPDSADTPM